MMISSNKRKVSNEEICVEGRRIKPIDLLTRPLDPSDDFEIEEINEPYIYMVFKGLTAKELEQLHDDIKMHLDNLDRTTTPTHIRIRYWEALLVVCEWVLAEARERDALELDQLHSPSEMIGEERGLHAGIEADVKNLLQGKAYVELEALQSQIESQMLSGTAKVVEYCEAVLQRLHIYKAKACLKDIHAKMRQNHLEHLETPSEGVNKKREMSPELDKQDSDRDLVEAEVLSPIPVMDAEVHDEELDEGSYSPQLLYGDENEEDAIHPEEDVAVLETTPADNFESNVFKVIGAMKEGDAVFGSDNEINLDPQVYWWHDRYRPRKPKYFNCVHTGYKWNKYNQTHYDHDNPPPKIVQGYKFNIFYPDLVDDSVIPTYTIANDGDRAETCIIRFHAGAPYEDIAFRIVNKEWEYSQKKRFKYTFKRGILHVYFNFKHYRQSRIQGNDY